MVNVHEGISQVRKFKVSMLFTKYETFKMKESESLLQMITDSLP